MVGRRTASAGASTTRIDDTQEALPTGTIDPAALGGCEREVFERWADLEGQIVKRDIDTLLRANLFLRRRIADLVAQAGRPKPSSCTNGYVAEVPTEVLEQVGQYGDYSHLDDGEAADKDCY